MTLSLKPATTAAVDVTTAVHACESHSERLVFASPVSWDCKVTHTQVCSRPRDHAVLLKPVARAQLMACARHMPPAQRTAVAVCAGLDGVVLGHCRVPPPTARLIGAEPSAPCIASALHLYRFHYFFSIHHHANRNFVFLLPQREGSV